MRIDELRVDGFGKLAGRTFAFAPGLTVVSGTNEAGKSTLAQAIAATLYGLERERERWRPWEGTRFATALRYTLADGRAFVVERDFDRDTRSVVVRDADGNDVSAQTVVGKRIAPGDAHLRVPLDVFASVAFARAGNVELGVAKAESIGVVLRHALDGGPRDDAALGAMRRLEDALKTHVRPLVRASAKAPVSRLRAEIAEIAGRASDVRDRLRAFDERRRTAEDAERRAGELDRAVTDLEARRSAARARALLDERAERERSRSYRAELQARLATYDDVANLALGSVAAIESAYDRWRSCDAAARHAGERVVEEAFSPALADELAARRLDAGTIDDATFAALAADDEAAARARDEQMHAAATSADLRRTAEGGATLRGVALAIALATAVAAVVAAFVQQWIVTGALATFAAVLVGVVGVRLATRREAAKAAALATERADDAARRAHDAGARVAAALARARTPTIAALAELRARYRRLLELQARSLDAQQRAREARAEAEAAARAFAEALATLGVAVDEPTLPAAIERVRALQRRRHERDGLVPILASLDVERAHRSQLSDEALRAEIDALRALGVTPATNAQPGEAEIARQLEAVRSDRDSERSAAEIARAEVRGAESGIEDLAALDEELARKRAELERLERFDRSLTLAIDTIERRTTEAHSDFARRLQDDAARFLPAVTGGRYADIRVTPNLEISARVPETGAAQPLAQLSSGTQAQTYLFVRFAMARLVAAGLEPLPIVLDDPFSTWDEDRLACGVPLIVAESQAMQTIVFTTDRTLAATLVARGASEIALSESPARSSRRRSESVSHGPAART